MQVNFLTYRFNTVFIILLTFLLNSTFAQAETIKVAVRWSKLPYINSDDNSGFELEIINEVFNKLGYQTKYSYSPYEDAIHMVKHGQADLALTLNNHSSVVPEFLSDVYITYQNVGLTLKRKNIKIKQIQDLSQLSIIGFQSANKALGKDFTDMVNSNSLYIEMADQRKQVELFLQGQVDAIILDINIFDYLSSELRGSNQLNNVDIHPLFPLNPYRAGFTDKLLKQKFNQELQKYLASSQYQTLKEKYKIKQISPLFSATN
ncbi:ABC transporter substrate-binding protein [Paraglaciecola sp. L3A3]|uniref:substrate-binding periplasmic protein n=1 Tax=Paraglaciecola sp. L3A3 TaxID=2686358 RepID=UPI00131A828F|nr:transporter substrate-binding domain-containing protein [Paraglaciecola sp. L3A3]